MIPKAIRVKLNEEANHVYKETLFLSKLFKSYIEKSGGVT
jgi:hypothetical protein